MIPRGIVTTRVGAAARLAALLLVAVGVGGACGGGGLSGGVPDGGSTAGPAAGPPLGALVGDCPAAAPASGSACTIRGLDCEYGADWDPACNVVAQCWRGGPLDATWQIAMRANDRTCPTPTALAAGCPASAPVAGGPCDTAGAFCPYATGACLCYASTTSAAMPVTTKQWACMGAPAAGCPAQRPRIGSACATSGLSCSYAVCNLGGGVYCDSGAWSDGTPPNLCAGG